MNQGPSEAPKTAVLSRAATLVERVDVSGDAIPLCGAKKTLLFFSAEGLQEYSLHGELLRRPTLTPIERATFSVDHSAVYFVARDRSVRVLELSTGEERKLAQLPDSLPSCYRASDGDTLRDPAINLKSLSLRNELSLSATTLDLDLHFVLVDRDRRTMSLEANLFVELATGEVRGTVTFPGGCSPPPRFGSGEVGEACAPPERGEPEGAVYRIEYEEGGVFTSQLITPSGERFRLRPGDWRESIAPSGKYGLVLGNITEGDYTHLDALLLDRREGKFYTLSEFGFGAELPKEKLMNIRGFETDSLPTYDYEPERGGEFSHPIEDVYVLGSLIVLPAEWKVVDTKSTYVP